MLFASSLISGTLTRREKKVLMHVRLDNGRDVIAYCPNSGDMDNIFYEGARAYLSHNPIPKRRARYILELIEVSGSLVSINSSQNVPLVAEAVMKQKIKELSYYKDISWRVNTPNLGYSGVDLLLKSDDENQKNCYVAINNIFLKRKADAIFPDSVTIGDQRQLLELEEIVSEGNRAVLLLLVRRMDCLSAKMVWDMDPLYSGILIEIINKGVEIACYSCSISLKDISIDTSIPIFI